MNCTASDLIADSLALSGLSAAQLQGIKTYLLATRYGVSTAAIYAAVGSYASLTTDQLAQIKVALLGGVSTDIVVANATPFLGISNTLAADVVILATIVGAPLNAATLLLSANAFTSPAFPNDAAQVFLLNRSNLGMADLAGLSARLNNVPQACVTCSGQSQIPYAEIGLLCASGSSLLDDLFEWWNFDNSLVGNFAGYTFNNVSPLFVAGKINGGIGAANAVAGQNGTAPGTSVFNIGRSFTVAGWYKATDGTIQQYAALAATGATTLLFIGSAAGMTGIAFSFTVKHTNVQRAVSTILTVGQWYCFIGGYDATLDQVFLRVDAGAVSLSTAFGVAANSDIPDLVTAADGPATGPGKNGAHDILALWQRRLTAAEMDAFYNNGNGVQFPIS